MFQGQFDLEDQSQGHQFSNSFETIMWSNQDSKLKVKFKMIQKFSLSQGIRQMMMMQPTMMQTMEPKTICPPKGTCRFLGNIQGVYH